MSSQTPPDQPAGWYPDPNHAGTQRYWDGANWTDQTRGGKHKFELAEGEQVYMTCRPAKAPRWFFYLITLGLYEFWRRANLYAVTDRRVAAKDGIITKTEGSLPLFYIQDATIQTFLWWGAVNVSTAGGDSGDLETHWLKKDDARRFRQLILDGAQRAREAGSAPSRRAS